MGESVSENVFPFTKLDKAIIMRITMLLGLLLCTIKMSAQPEVKVFYNQIGYLPGKEKVIVIEGVISNATLQVTDAVGKVVLCPVVSRVAVSPWSGKERAVIDVSALRTPGTYTLRAQQVKTDFCVRPHAYHELSVAALKLFYLMRSGTPIVADYAGVYARRGGHPDQLVVIHPSAASEGRPAGSFIKSPLGWYDAGDYNKYIVNSAFSIGLMLHAYEQNKDYFARLDTHIPESRNATPDLLDEMMFNLRWMLTMQDPSDGGVYHKLTTPDFEAFVSPADCHQLRYVVAKSVTATLDFAAVMALAARLMRGNADYPLFSSQAEQAARRAYQWALAHPDAYYQQDEMNKTYQPAVNTGTYGDNYAGDERFWAATELYLLTADKRYLADARTMMPDRFTVPTWGNVAGLAVYAWLASSESDLQQVLLAQLREYAETAVAQVPTSCFQSPFGNQAGDFGWGCLAENCCGGALALLYADRYVEEGRYRRYALQNADYLLGRNATGYCYVTGFGVRSPQHPHHRLSASDGVEAPMPGMLVGGPNPDQQDKGMGGLVYPNRFPDESYVDHQSSYASNEIAINWNASLVALIGWIDALL